MSPQVWMVVAIGVVVAGVTGEIASGMAAWWWAVLIGVLVGDAAMLIAAWVFDRAARRRQV